jgi:oligoendopeptidase F
VLTFAHEIGHGIHEYSVAKNGPLMNRNPLIFAETASIFSEFLIFDLMLKKVKTKEEKVALLMQKIEDQLNTIARQTAFFRFEKLLHELAKTKPLIKKDVQDIWMQVQKESLGDSFIFHDAYKNYWVYVSHFFHSPFYVYAYVFGDLFASAMYDLYKQDPIEFTPKYKNFLQKTSVANYQEVFSIFDFQKGTTNFWENSLNYTIKLIEELEFII